MTVRETRVTPDGQLVVTWDDGHVSTYSLAGLRAGCACPVCRPVEAGAAEGRPWAVRMTRGCLLVSLYVLPLGLLFMVPTVETVVVSCPVVVLLSLCMGVAGWLARWRWVPTLAVSHVVLCLFLMTLVGANNWSPWRAWGPFMWICTPYVLAAGVATWWVYRHPPPVKLAPSWNCRGCGYLLVGLDGNRCPECGQEFDRSELPTTPPEGVESGAR